MLSSATLVSIFFLSQFCWKGDCIRCYQCNSLIDDIRGCSVSPPSDLYLKNCSLFHPNTNEQFNEENIWCRKIRNHRIPMIPGHKRSVIRECAYHHWDNEVCFKGKWQLICECRGNACNGSTLPFKLYETSLLLFITALCLYSVLY